MTDTFECDECGDEMPTAKRWRDLLPNQPEDADEVAVDDLCPRCSTRKDGSRLFRAGDDLPGGESDA
ncbi:hypothetical protein [Haloarcula litorea]|uniref:hypothetical protein n=1 Tax=Haloarcula litorea TaxID=3032579 RepID=UPI0023E8E740|nr:hypothetical protein [Halomicroarcula sp. GDY20]